MKGLTGRRVLQCRSRLTTGPGDPPAAPAGIDRVADDRVTEVFQVNPNLVGATGVQLEAEEVHHLEPCHHRGIGSGGTTLCRDRHTFAIPRMASDRRVDSHLLRVQVTPG